ncbi:MAG: nitroreductase family protein [Burkholderiales bacterium PBB6]|uniref:Nitroreductase family protein n=1 Tax=Ideonella margarita TaxID=2984191 RepID=A0ABU9C429_9BURK|nr:MAG: nitroreductase family protein [Burkholderiales bacterium PBB6]
MSQRQAAHPIDPQFTDRWSPRAFTGEAIAADALLGLLEAARWAPSASNIQPARFLFGHAGTPAFATILDGLVPFNQGWAGKASALVVVLSKTSSVAPGQTEAKANVWHAFDAGAAWMSLALQAHLKGYITHAMGGFDGDKLRAALNVPADVAIHAVVAVGKQGDKASLPEGLQARELPNDRLPLAQLAAEGAWSF